MSSEDEGGNVLHTDFEFLRDESAEAGGVEYSGHADDALAGESAHLIRGLRHSVEWIGNDDEDAVRRVMDNLADYVVHDFVICVEQVIAAHARLAGDSGGDHHDVGVCGVGVVI